MMAKALLVVKERAGVVEDEEGLEEMALHLLNMEMEAGTGVAAMPEVGAVEGVVAIEVVEEGEGMVVLRQIYNKIWGDIMKDLLQAVAVAVVVVEDVEGAETIGQMGQLMEKPEAHNLWIPCFIAQVSACLCWMPAHYLVFIV